VARPGQTIELHPDRLLPADPAERKVARRIYEAVRDQPLISPHGHVDPALLLLDQPFADPAALFVTPDHYVTRVLHADGVPLDHLGVGAGRLPEAEARRVWRLLCERWELFRGTPVKLWLEAELAEIFGVTLRPSAETADRMYDELADRLADPAFRPRALYERFRLEVLCTTIDPCDDLSSYTSLAADPSWAGRALPIFRPDRYLEPERPDWVQSVRRLAEAAAVDTGTYQGYVRALEERRRAFIDRGSTSSDHAHIDAGTQPLDPHEAERIYRSALAGTASDEEAIAFRRHMVFEMARMSCEDGLVMTLHPGVRRNHHRPTAARFGPDVGADIPVRIEFTDALRPLLERFGTAEGLHLVIFTTDETTWSRELAPLAGFYPSVFVGVPWWFLDAPDAIRRFHAAVSETTGFTRTSGFIDDTRAFCSVPVRHDMSRRLDAGMLARQVTEHRLDEDEAAAVALDLATVHPTRVFKL
jgi:glucuronate isomerase